jgi:hypothetical protein
MIPGNDYHPIEAPAWIEIFTNSQLDGTIAVVMMFGPPESFFWGFIKESDKTPNGNNGPSSQHRERNIPWYRLCKCLIRQGKC